MLQMLQIENLTDALEKLALLYNIEIKRDGEKISLKTIEEINSLVNLLQLIQKYLRLKKSGKNYLGKCCFHHNENDEKLSLEVDPQKNRYYCFDCEASGGVTDFLSHKFKSSDRVSVSVRTPQKQFSQKNQQIKTIVPIPDRCNWSENDWVTYYVERLSPWRADDYDAWVKVGMATESMGDPSMLAVWEKFSQTSPKYKPGECEKKWRSFRRNDITIASIYQWAKEDKIPPPDESISAFKRCVELLYSEYADGRIDLSILNLNLLEARKNFWTWRNSDRAWKDLVDEIRSRFIPSANKSEIIYGNSNYVDRSSNKTFNNGDRESTWGNREYSHNSPGESPKNSETAALIEQIKAILAKFPHSESSQTSALQNYALSLGRNYRDIELLTRIIQREGEEAENIIEAMNSLKVNLKEYHKRLNNLENYLDPVLYELLKKAAEAMPTAIEYLFNSILPACASRIGTASKIIINAAGNYQQPCIFWTANVNHSGQAKTPPQKLIISPLEEKEGEAACDSLLLGASRN